MFTFDRLQVEVPVNEDRRACRIDQVFRGDEGQRVRQSPHLSREPYFGEIRPNSLTERCDVCMMLGFARDSRDPEITAQPLNRTR